ncbi:ribonuclease H-like domain-containing protein [Tanacetum coccineum]|uniref:Ribonuclease H-like domain-containing protein n=1 Tax=Tanacetum coccineum TaxID=301880 RepID=A0ABQ4XLH8_9ASTR
MESEMSALLSNHTWTLVQRPSHANIVYMKQPPRYVDPAPPTYVCHLRKSLYGHKQAPRAWYHCFAIFIASICFVSNTFDNSLFTYHRGYDTIFLLLYVDDIILIASSASLVHRVISRLSIDFSMTDLGELSYFVGIASSRSSSGLFLSQSSFARDILARACMSTCNSCTTPADTKSKLSSFGTPVSDLTLYRSLAVDRLVSYIDADWAGCPDTRRSTSGIFVFLGVNLVSWSSKRKHVISRSSGEAEYKGVANVVAEAAWLRNLLLELSCPLKRTTIVFCDIVSAVYLASNPIQH